MLKMVSEKITGNKGPQMIPVLCTCIVRLHFRGMRQAMRKVSAEIKKLKSGYKSRYHPKGDELRFAEKYQADIEQHSHNDNLPDSEIGFHK